MRVASFVIAAIAAAGFSFAAAAAPIAQPSPVDSKNAVMLVGHHHHMHHHMHHGHWRHHHGHWRGGPGCFLPFPAPFCWW